MNLEEVVKVDYIHDLKTFQVWLNEVLDDDDEVNENYEDVVLKENKENVNGKI